MSPRRWNEKDLLAGCVKLPGPGGEFRKGRRADVVPDEGQGRVAAHLLVGEAAAGIRLHVDLEWPNKQRYINYSVEGTIDRLGHSIPTLIYRETWVEEDNDRVWAFAPEITVTGMQQYIPNSKNYYPPPAYYQALGPGAAAQIKFTGSVTVTTKKTSLDMTCPGSFSLDTPTDGLSVTFLK